MQRSVISAAVTLAALLAPRPAAAADFLIADFDPRAYVGRLVGAGPDGEAVVVSTREGRIPVEVLSLEHRGRRAHLVLWRGSPRDPTVYPELWVREDDGRTARVWPPTPEYAWLEPDVAVERPVEAGAGDRLRVTRRLGRDGKGRAVRTTEWLDPVPAGYDLADKEVGPVRDERALLLAARDLVLVGVASGVADLARGYRAAERPWRPETAAALRAIVTRHARGLGLSPPPDVPPSLPDRKDDR